MIPLSILIYWLIHWHILVSKGTSGFTSNIILILLQDLFMVYIVNRLNKNSERNEIKAMVWLLLNMYSDLLRELQSDRGNCKVNEGNTK